MIYGKDCLKKYGAPSASSPFMELVIIPEHIRIPNFPSRIFCNKDMREPLLYAMAHLISTGCADEIKTYDGCFNIRKMRAVNAPSLHSWGVAIDINAFENQLYTKGKFSQKFVECFKYAGFDWGGDWKKRTDPMHFQLSKI